MLDARQYTGRASQQVEEYLKEEVVPITQKYNSDLDNKKSELNL